MAGKRKKGKRGAPQTTLQLGRGSRRQAKRSRALHTAGRWFAWSLLGTVVLAALWGAGYGLRRVFFLDNAHFTVEHIQPQVYGRLTPADVVKKLDEIGIKRGQTNLFAVDLEHVRQELEDWHVLVQRAVVSRRLPDRLVVEIYERQPVAQLTAPRGKLIDDEGRILPPRRNAQVSLLPIITGIPGIGSARVGTVLEGDLVSSALYFLELLDTQPYGKYLQVNLIQLDRAEGALKVFVRERDPFREGACIILPAEPEAMQKALQRVSVIVRNRLKARQQTGFIDATYETNVPVRSHSLRFHNAHKRTGHL